MMCSHLYLFTFFIKKGYRKFSQQSEHGRFLNGYLYDQDEKNDQRINTSLGLQEFQQRRPNFWLNGIFQRFYIGVGKLEMLLG